MIDFIQVDARYAWEPMTGADSHLYITVDGNRSDRIIRAQEELDAREWFALLMFDAKGQRVIVFFDRDIPNWVARRVLIRQIDLQSRTLTISGITDIAGKA